MKHVAALLLFSLLAFPLIPAEAGSTDDSFSPRVREILQRRLKETGVAESLVAGGEPVYARMALPEFYRRRLYHPAWSWRGQSTVAVTDLLTQIREAAAEGLVPEHYHLPAIEALLAQLAWKQPGGRQSAALLADLDLLLTDAFLALGSHFLGGRIDPATIDPEWHARSRRGDPVQVLEHALRTGSVGAALRGLLPPQPEYAGLRRALVDYRLLAAAGGWPTVPEGRKLRRGDVGARVSALRSRLAVTGEVAEGTGGIFDRTLEEGVRRFQLRHGLEDDGVVGRATLAALNVPASERVRQIEVNLERWRWLPQNLGERFVLVNIADFTLTLIDQGEAVMDMRVVVGRPIRHTPVFSDRITYLVLNPSWQVPDMIAVKDILPQMRQDGSYLEKMGIKVFQGWGAKAREIDPGAIDWQRMTPENFPYRLRQEPGPLNALGRIKFMLPNDHDIYLHDTPARELFRKEERTFSSGCIRIEKPLELAEYLLQGTSVGNRPALEAALIRDRNTAIALPKPIPVHLLYWTSWVDRQGKVHFRHDIYGRDETLRLALDQPPQAVERIAPPWRHPDALVDSQRRPRALSPPRAARPVIPPSRPAPPTYFSSHRFPI